jgi:hypothetical protein
VDAVTALIAAGLLAAEAEKSAGPLAVQAIRQQRAGAEAHSRINPDAAAGALVAALQQHNLLTQPSTKEPAA